MNANTKHLRRVACLAALLPAFALGACGGDDDSGSAKVGDCIDAANKVVDCNSPDAKQRLVTDQDKPDAIACVQIGDKPQTEVEVGGKKFCAEPK